MKVGYFRTVLSKACKFACKMLSACLSCRIFFFTEDPLCLVSCIHRSMFFVGINANQANGEFDLKISVTFML